MDLWKVLSWWSQMHKTAFALTPGELFWVIFYQLLYIVILLTFVFFLITIQLLHIIFLLMFLVLLRLHYLEGYLTKKPFYTISSSARSHFEIFWGSLWAVPWLILWNFIQMFFCIILTVNALRKILQH